MHPPGRPRVKINATIANMTATASRPLSLLLLLLTIAAVLRPLVYFNTFSGDAEIHLVYARNFLDGYPLQFNPGEPSSGQTSMGFMFILVPIMKLFGEAATPLAMKLIGLCSLYTIAVQTARLAIRAWAGCALASDRGNRHPASARQRL